MSESEVKKTLNLNPAEHRLADILSRFERIAIAFSGGLDSTILAAFAAKILGRENVLLIHADTHTSAAGEDEYCRIFAEKNRLRLLTVDVVIYEHPEVRANTSMRCYHCKKMLMEKMNFFAMAEGVSVVCDGANIDDLSDWRPGMKAADEMGIIHPYIEAKFGKKEIRLTGRRLGLSDYTRASSACMASRIPTGTPITECAIRMATKAELILHEMGFPQVRVRIIAENTARIEVNPLYLRRLERKINVIITRFKSIGFEHVSIDPLGYRRGSMNRAAQL